MSYLLQNFSLLDIFDSVPWLLDMHALSRFFNILAIPDPLAVQICKSGLHFIQDNSGLHFILEVSPLSKSEEQISNVSRSEHPAQSQVRGSDPLICGYLD